MFSQLTRDFHPARLFPALTAGVVIAVLEVVYAVSFAALIFYGDLSLFLARGIGFALFGTSVAGIMIALASSLPGVVGGNQDVPAAIMGVIATSIAMQYADASVSQTFVNVVATIGLTTLLTGLFFFGLGYFKLGGLVRYLPYPVVGGFLAGTGWLLAIGAIGLMAGTPVDFSSLSQLFQPSILLRWIPGVLFAFLILVLSKRFQHFLFLPGMLGVAIVVFYLIASLAGLPVSEVSAQGWLLGPFPEGGIFQPLTWSDLGQIHWPVIFGQATSITAILVVSSVALLLNASGLELAANRDVDLNQEMRAAGLGNLLAGLGGGMVNYQQLSLSALNIKLGADSRLAGLFGSVACALVLILGGSVLAIFPKVVAGGLLLYLGLAFLGEWVFDSWYRFPRIDYAIILMILLVIASIGFLQGVAVGVVATVVMFVVNYGRIDIVKHTLPGTAFHSRVTRPTSQQQVLNQENDQIHIFQLQGFLFFGTAHHLLERVRQVVQERTQSLRYFLIDFSQVTGLDSTAMYSFAKMKQLAEVEKFAFLFTGLSPALREQFEKNQLVEIPDILNIFPDPDHGFEWCEEQILQTAGLESDHKTLPAHLDAIIRDTSHIDVLMKYLERLECRPGEYLIRQGEESDAMYLVESGQVTAQLEVEGQSPVRLETMRGGRVVGEIGFYLRATRTACVIVDKPSVLYRLTLEQLQAMEENDPEAASTFHRIMVQLTAERVAHLIRAVDALQR